VEGNCKERCVKEEDMKIMRMNEKKVFLSFPYLIDMREKEQKREEG
jgi:hypothetical protein